MWFSASRLGYENEKTTSWGMCRSMQSCKTSGCMSSVGDSGTRDRHFAGCRGFSGILEFRMKTENLETLKDQLKFGGFDLFLISNM